MDPSITWLKWEKQPAGAFAAGRLGTEISYSQSDYVNILMDEVYILKDIQNIVHGIIEDSVKMLNIAKKIYQDGDIQISDMLSEGK